MDSPDKIHVDKVDGSIDGSEISTYWSETEEILLKGISERSNCMRWLHTQCMLYFESLNFYLTIPNVIISTLNGSFTMALSSLFPEPGSQRVGQTIIGLISIFSAILITMNQYVKSQQMMEAHRASALAHGKLYRIIMNELSIRRDRRINCIDFLKTVRSEIDRLENTAPSIPQKIIARFNVQFQNRDIEKPEITGDLDKVEVNHESMSKKLVKFIKAPRTMFSVRNIPAASLPDPIPVSSSVSIMVSPSDRGKKDVPTARE
jgi:hypothetical protein